MRLLLTLLVLVRTLSGQVSTGSVSGTVVDESGGVMAMVNVSIRQETTGFTRTSPTDKYGVYRFEELTPGSYTIRAEHPGFRTTIVSQVRVEVNQQVRLDLRMTIGETHDSVEVTAKVSVVQTADSSVGYRLDSATFAKLPLDDRRIASLVTIGPGAVPRHLGGFVHDSYNDIQQGSRGSVALNPPINGARSTMNSSFLDGAYNTDRNTFAPVVSPPMEAVQEFRVQSSLSPAPFVQSGGGVVDVVTKSGGQTVHGNVFEYLRNGITDARNYFDDPTLPRADYRRNQFGASVGGPMPFPSAFFFVAYEGLRGRSASSRLERVPAQAPRSGDFRGGRVIYDPLNLSASGARIPFAEGRIPAQRMDPIAAKFLADYEPLPNYTGNPGANYMDRTPRDNRHDLLSARGDHQFRDGSLLFARYIMNDEQDGVGGLFPVRPISEKLRAQQAVAGFSRAGVSWSDELRASFTRLRLFNVPYSAFQQNDAAELGILDPPTDPFTFGLPFFFIGGYATVTDDPSSPQVQRDNLWSLAESVSYGRGRQTLRAGVQFTGFQLNYRQSNNVRGRYTYSGGFTGDGAANSVGDALADFLLGYPQFTQRSTGNSQAYMRQHGYAMYVQQEWRATAGLTLMGGLRYEFWSPFKEKRSAMLNLDYSTLPAPPTVVPVERSYSPNRTDFAPRAGLAFRLPGPISRGGETVFRASYGIYFNQESALESYSLVRNGIRNESNAASPSEIPVLTTRDGFPRTSSTGLSSFFGLDRDLPTPYVQQWNAGFQRALPADILFEAAYVGTKAVHLGRARQFNTALQTETGANLPPRPGNLQALRTFPNLGPITQFQHIANSSYHSLQLKYEKKFRRSLALLASFVWAKSIDDSSSVVPSLFDSGAAQDERNLRLERGLSRFHVGRRFSAGFVFVMPVPQKLPSLLGGWQMSGVITIQDGVPADPLYVTRDPANAGTFTRPDLVPGESVTLPRSLRSPERWFNTAAFASPPPFRFGNAGRNIIPGPGYQLFDLALHKNFPIRDIGSIEFRAEGFNAFNHPNFDWPNPYPDTGPSFGRLLLSGQPRRVQFGLRISF